MLLNLQKSHIKTAHDFGLWAPVVFKYLTRRNLYGGDSRKVVPQGSQSILDKNVQQWTMPAISTRWKTSTVCDID